MTKNTKSFVLPLTFIGIMFFAIGFALGINSLLVPVLQKSLGISNTASYLIIAATFIPFLVFGYPAGLTIKAIGYKRTMSLSFFIFAIAFYLFILSADQESFTLFLLASFISGAANAYLQASVNPYITILGPLDSAAKRISIMGICNKLAWPIPRYLYRMVAGERCQSDWYRRSEQAVHYHHLCFYSFGYYGILRSTARSKSGRRRRKRE